MIAFPRWTAGCNGAVILRPGRYRLGKLGSAGAVLLATAIWTAETWAQQGCPYPLVTYALPSYREFCGPEKACGTSTICASEQIECQKRYTKEITEIGARNALVRECRAREAKAQAEANRIARPVLVPPEWQKAVEGATGRPLSSIQVPSTTPEPPPFQSAPARVSPAPSEETLRAEELDESEEDSEYRDANGCRLRDEKWGRYTSTNDVTMRWGCVLKSYPD